MFDYILTIQKMQNLQKKSQSCMPLIDNQICYFISTLPTLSVTKPLPIKSKHRCTVGYGDKLNDWEVYNKQLWFLNYSNSCAGGNKMKEDSKILKILQFSATHCDCFRTHHCQFLQWPRFSKYVILWIDSSSPIGGSFTWQCCWYYSDTLSWTRP